MPIVRLTTDGSYLIGTEAKQLSMRGSHCMVRVGGGYVTLEEYYDRYSLKQCVALFHTLSSSGNYFVDTVIGLLHEHTAS